MNKLFIIVSFIAASVASAKSTYPANKVYEKPVESYKSQAYSFDWGVKDESYNDYSHSESSDGKMITGSYRVELPDGRAQIVSYKVDSNGYIADVQYEGEAKYPPAKSATYPAYPAQVYPNYKAPVAKYF